MQTTEEGKKGRKQHAYSTASTESHGCTGAEQFTRLLFSTYWGIRSAQKLNIDAEALPEHQGSSRTRTP